MLYHHHHHIFENNLLPQDKSFFVKFVRYDLSKLRTVAMFVIVDL
jgi:hypothetical protein